jgi:beta-N-acetylhexosaminidase
LDFPEDLQYIKDAYQEAKLTEKRMMEALHSILGFKAMIGLDQYSEETCPSKEGLFVGCEEHKKVQLEMSDQAIALAKICGLNC